MAKEINNNTSYTNKDFQAIYAELLDLIPSLTNRWNPSSEADPGIVLVKLMAVLGDKLNYNIDKQVLECFPGSVTQRKNARQLFNLIGYKMPWYRAAITSVGFKLKDFDIKDDSTVANVTIPRFTQLTDVNNSLSFFTLSDVVLYGDDNTTVKHVDAIQGNLVQYKVNDTTQIKLSNLDENYKLYLTDINVAENGIFIKDYGASVYDWKQVDNVDSYPIGNKVYEFGISDDETQCYLKFPVDVNDQCISDSLDICYITCDGKDGNIVSNVLSNFSNEILDSVGEAATANVAISQPSATHNGEDPETIAEAYTNSRRVVGTFDTLVTKLDFQNYIKLLEDENNKPFISNIVVADRNNDFNSSIKIKSLENFITKDRVVSTEITAYDLIAYMLRYQPVYLDDDLATCDSNYNESFKPVTDESTKLIIENLLSDVKSINIDLNLTSNDSIALFKGVYAITAEIVTTEKVTKDEATELETTIKKNLEDKYQAYNMEFGTMVNYSDLVETITSIDSRIKAVSLRDIQYNLKKIVMPNDEAVELTSEDKQAIVAKSIVRGNVQAYKFNDTFEPEFGQTGAITQPTVISTAFEKSLTPNVLHTLKGGQVINLYAPKVSVNKSYAGGCRVIWVPSTQDVLDTIEGIGSSGDQSQTPYPLLTADNYFLVGPTGIGEITITYLDSNNTRVYDKIEAGSVIKCNQTIKPNSAVATSNTPGQIISTGNQLDVYTDDKFTLAPNTKYVLYLDSAKNDPDKKIQLSAGQEILLGVNDYLLYYETVSMSWVQLSSGYTIKNETSSTIELSVIQTNKDLITYASNNAYQLMNALTIIDNDIITLNQGCAIEYISSRSQALAISSTPVSIQANNSIKIIDSTGTHEISSNPRGVMYKVVTRLDLIYTTTPIKLEDGDKVITNIATYTGSATESNTYYISFSKPVTVVGGTGIDISNISLYAYKQTSGVNRVNGILNLTATQTYNISVSGNHLKLLLPIHVKDGGSVRVTYNGTTNGVGSMDKFTGEGNVTTNTYSTGDYILSIPKAATSLTFTVTAGSIQLGKLLVVEGINSEELSGYNYVVSSDEFTRIIQKANALAGAYKVDYTYKVPSEDKCANPINVESFFDANHVYNGLVIAQMDTENYKIVVNKFSIRS